jgi:membrane protease YdiL (CAAX protease family)
MLKRISYPLIIILIAGIAGLQIVFLLQVFASDFFSAYAESVGYASRFYGSVIYITLGVVILIEIRNLDRFHLDKFTIATFILSCFLRQRSGIIGEELLLIIIGLIGALLIFALIIIKPKFLRTDFRWAVVGIALGLTSAIVITLFELLLRHTWQLNPLFRGSLIATVFNYITREFSLGALMEEIMFRGILWGHLRERNWAESRIYWAQGFLFWLLHLSKIVTPFTLFFSIPLLTLISTMLTRRAKHIFPAILAHTVINVASALLGLATF